MGSNNTKVKDSVNSSASNAFMEYDKIIAFLSEGDLIEIHRCSYRHWVIFDKMDGDGNVWCFHVKSVRIDDNIINSSVNSKACIQYNTLLNILYDDRNQVPSKCRINNQQQIANRLIKKTNSSKPKINQVLSMLHYYKNVFVDYNDVTRNAQHYVTYWKYGIGWNHEN